MIRILLAATILGLILCSHAPAQKTSVSTATKNLASTLVITVDSDGASVVSLQFDEYAGNLFTEDVQDLFKRLDQPQNSRAAMGNTVLVRPEADTEISKVVTVIAAARSLKGAHISVDSGNNTYFTIAPKAQPAAIAKPNPLSLLVRVEKNGDIFLNNQKFGTLLNSAPLEKTLTQIFTERENNGVYREGSNDVEKTVTVKVPAFPYKFGNLILLASALQKAGAGPVILQVD